MTSDTEKFDRISSYMKEHYPVLSNVVQNAPLQFGAEWVPAFVNHAESLFGEIDDRQGMARLEAALEGYAEFANDSLRSQVYFEKTGQYPSSDYEAAKVDFYNNEQHMRLNYLPGMYLSHYLWPQHYHMLNGFCNSVLPRIKRASTFFEIGVGCGVYSLTTVLPPYN